MKRVLFLLSLFCVSTTISADTPLGAIEVNATTTDGAIVTIPISLLGHFVNQSSPNYKVCGDGGTCVLALDKAAVCSQLKADQPQGCTVTNYPAAPGVSSASGAIWAGNGCGADPWSTAFAAGTLLVMLPGVFSGDLNKPVQNNPSIDFTAICNNHDQGYTSSLPKGIVDNQFNKALTSFCNTSTNAQLCQGFAAAYTSAVDTYGKGAYAEDQAQLACAAWGSAMKGSKCSS
jgi:hypothetical protein